MSMNTADVFPAACAAVRAVTDGARDAELSLPTPCRDWALSLLVNHFVGTTGAMARAGRHEPLDPVDPWGSKTDVAGGDWSARLAHNLEAVAEAWSRSEAWQGSVDAGGHEMPARMLGDTALMEVVLHGWDVATATAQPYDVSADVAAVLLDRVAASAELGRQMEAFGPEVAVAGDASALDRALGLSGRDPNRDPSVLDGSSFQN